MWCQGSHKGLNPLLFLIYINDLPENIHSSVRLFADDCVLYKKIMSIRDTMILQKYLETLSSWEHHWQMSFNPDKCYVLRIPSSRSRIIASYKLGNSILQVNQTALLPGGRYSKWFKMGHTHKPDNFVCQQNLGFHTEKSWGVHYGYQKICLYSLSASNPPVLLSSMGSPPGIPTLIPKYRHYDIAYYYIIEPNKSHTLCCRRKEASFFQAF